MSTAVGFLLWIAVLRVLPAGTASLNMFAIPVIALVSSAVVFGERLSAARMDRASRCIGAGLVIVARAGDGAGAVAATSTPLDRIADAADGSTAADRHRRHGRIDSPALAPAHFFADVP